MLSSHILQLRVVILLSAIIILIYLLGKRDVPNPERSIETIVVQEEISHLLKKLEEVEKNLDTMVVSSVPEKVWNTNDTYAKFDKSLCQYHQKKRDYYVGTKPCPKNVVTVQQAGRLCNQMWEYAAVWAAAKRTGYEPYVPTCLHKEISAIYSSITAGKFEEIAHCPLNESTFVLSRYGPWDGTNNLIIPKYIVEVDLILAYVKDLPEEFVLNEDLAEESQRQIRSLNQPDGTVYVAVHIRKTDYTNYLKDVYEEKPADESFYENAMRIFEDKYEQVAFVVVSDDPDWCYGNFGTRKNVNVIGKGRKNTAKIDLAILSSCNHTIFDYGTYGSWGAVMAGGETIYYNLTSHLTAWIGKILNWRTL